MDTYTCECCGKVLDNWPALTFKVPDSYYWLSDGDKANSTIDDDFCIVNTEGGIYRFIRVVMFQKVIDSCQQLHYGLWVSLSKESYDNYRDYYGSEDYKAVYFGWLNSSIPQYGAGNGKAVAMDVHTQKKGKRPYVVPHRADGHPLVADFYQGITKEEAEDRIRAMMGA